MCGITGILDTSGKREIDRGLLSRMNDSQFHRGPDESGLHVAPGLGLGHRRLSIIDLSSGQQPLFNEDKSVVVTYNGEIYNFKDLTKELLAKGHQFRTHCDTEVIVHAWEEWGEECVKRFRGMFAFAVWDSNSETLFLARDRLGQKPLHYTVLSDGMLVFGSELKSILTHPDVPRVIDPRSVEDYFGYGYVPDPRTIFKGIYKLPPGHTLTVRRHSARPGARRILGHFLQPHDRPFRAGNRRGAHSPPARSGEDPHDRRCAARRIPLGRRRFERGRRHDGAGVRTIR